MNMFEERQDRRKQATHTVSKHGGRKSTRARVVVDRHQSLR